MRNNRFVILFFWGIMAMIINFSGCASQKFEKYSSKDQELGLEIDYFSGWKSSETRGAYGSYAEVSFTEPVLYKKPLRAIVVVMAQKMSQAGLKEADLDGFGRDLIKQRLKLKDGRLKKQSDIELLSAKAIDLRFSYSLPDNPDRLDAKFVPLVERVIVFVKGERFYTFRYVNTEKDFNKFDKAFMHCVSTLQFK